MGVNTDAQAVPFQPPPPQPGITPSGIGVGARTMLYRHFWTKGLSGLINHLHGIEYSLTSRWI